MKSTKKKQKKILAKANKANQTKMSVTVALMPTLTPTPLALSDYCRPCCHPVAILR